MRLDRISVPLVPDPFVHELRVRYGECDPQGIVFNANYLAYFDIAATELWREAFGSWQHMVDRGIDVVVGEANVRFRAPARFDDVLALRARIARFGTTSMTTEIEIARDGELLVDGWLRQICVDATTWAKTEIPGWLREGLERYAA
jgi:acyl-CoA thioester hydrolase